MVRETLVLFVRKHVVHMACLDAGLVALPESGVEQVAVVLHEHLAHCVVAQQERAESLGEDILGADRVPDFGRHLFFLIAPEAVAGSEKMPALPLKAIETSNRPPVAATKRVFRDGRTSIMGAIMSPGSELQSMRRASILAGLAQDAKAGATNQAAAPMTAVKRLKSGVSLTRLQEQSLKGLVEVTEGLTRVLAEDNMGGFFKLASVLPTQFTLIRDGFETNHPWSGMIQEILRTGVPVARMGDWPSTRTLEGARGLFQEFSGSMSNLAKELRKNDPDFAGLKIYQYSLDSSTNRWIQAAGPLRNPFTGVRLAASGAEVLD